MFWCKFKKIIAGSLIGFGVGTIMVLFLPPVAWMCIMGIGMFIRWYQIFVGKIGGIYDNSCKKGSKMFERNCENYFWN